MVKNVFTFSHLLDPLSFFFFCAFFSLYLNILFSFFLCSSLSFILPYNAPVQLNLICVNGMSLRRLNFSRVLKLAWRSLSSGTKYLESDVSLQPSSFSSSTSRKSIHQIRSPRIPKLQTNFQSKFVKENNNNNWFEAQVKKAHSGIILRSKVKEQKLEFLGYQDPYDSIWRIYASIKRERKKEKKNIEIREWKNLMFELKI